MSRGLARVGLCVDSNSQIPPALAARLGVEVVPLVVTIDGTDHLEGVDLDADAFYAAYAAAAGAGRIPDVSTSQPAPGAFAAAYARLAARGADAILSVHIGSALSGTLASAAIAARTADVPVRFVDTGTASFGITCCAWAAADALAAGADIDAAATAAETTAAQVGTAFVAGVQELVARSGRATALDLGSAGTDGTPVLAMHGGELDVLTSARTLDDAVEAMVDYVDQRRLARSGVDQRRLARSGVDQRRLADSGGDRAVRVAIGTSDASSRPVADALRHALSTRFGEPGSDPGRTGGGESVGGVVDEVIDYRIGPSIGAHTGPGTAGLFVF